MMPVRTRLLSFVIPLLLMACQREEAEPSNAVAPEAATNLAETLPLPDPAMDRSAFLAAVAAAASAHTAGVDDRKAQAALDGRRFAIRLRFGCGGPAETVSAAPLRWTANEDGNSFEIRATPDLSIDLKQFDDSQGETIEAVEGFWLERPWLTSDACPARSADALAAAGSPPQLVGIAQYFTEQDSRVEQRSGRSYVSVEKVASPEELPKDGLVLRLEGRLRTWPGGKVVICRGTGATLPPQCIAAIRLDRAAFERPGSGEVLAEWRS